MANQNPFFFFFCLLALAAGLLAATDGAKEKSRHYSKPFNRSCFPAGFIFGAGSAAYQIEGAALEDGKGPSVWDTFAAKYPERIVDRSTGDVAVDFYHRYKEDIKLMKKIGLDSFRFSISWSRILPKGKLSSGVNPAGVQFYNNLIDQLLANGLKPFVTLIHFDHPQALEDDYGGFSSPKIVDDYVDYADFCFKTFGDRVKHWVTMNEPNGWSIGGTNGSASTSPTESYILAHHLLLFHAAAVKLYREKYQASQKGKIGFTIITNWFIPKFDTTSDRNAASRALDFLFGWFVDPVIFDEYPKSMQSLVGSRLPKFTEAESKMLKGSIDFLGVNYYTANYAQNALPSNTTNFVNDNRANLTTEKNGVPIGTPTQNCSWSWKRLLGLRPITQGFVELKNGVECWKFPGNSYKTAAVWDCIRPRKEKAVWHRLLWAPLVMPKHVIIAWMAIQNKLPTMDRLKKWGLEMDDTCVLCQQTTETREHLFFECPFAVKIWKEMLRKCGLERDSLGWEGELKWAVTKLKGKAMISTLLRVGWNAFVYHIWRERNCRIFQHQTASSMKILEDIREVIQYRLVKLSKVKADEVNIALYRAWGLSVTIFD